MLCKNIPTALHKPERPLAAEANTHQKFNSTFAEQYPLRILLIEDNPVNMKLAERLLQKLGYKPDIGWNGLEALDAVAKHPYNLVLMDVQMPEMDGLEATQKIRSMYGEQPRIIAMTANEMQDDRDQCIQAGMDDYISKPIRLEDFMKLVGKWALNLQGETGKGRAMQ